MIYLSDDKIVIVLHFLHFLLIVSILLSGLLLKPIDRLLLNLHFQFLDVGFKLISFVVLV